MLTAYSLCQTNAINFPTNNINTISTNKLSTFSYINFSSRRLYRPWPFDRWFATIPQEGVVMATSKMSGSDYRRKTTNGWNQETKTRLSDKVASNMNDVASLTRQVLRGSKTNEVCWKCSIIAHKLRFPNYTKYLYSNKFGYHKFSITFEWIWLDCAFWLIL